MATMTQSDGKASILDNRTKYTIPIYQREYSWGWEQISRFVGDIFKGFWGAEEEKRIICEPMFIGTMQLSEKKETGTNKYTQDVIDGQQRLSTMMCIFKYLKLKYPGNKALGEIRLDWLETRVNNGKEQESLEAMLGMSDLDGANMDNEQNPYVRSIGMIDECFNNLTTDENGEPMEAFTGNIGAFVEYLLNDIYFVVIETTAGLSKTIQIFNTINTAGLDLNGDDLFKVRLYEYLHDVKGHGEDSFTEIGGIYKDVKKRNEEWLKTHGWDLVNMGVVRTVYKDYLISKHKLPVSLYAMGTDTFFERLFDVLLNVQSHKEMASAKTVELALDDLRRIINAAVCKKTIFLSRAKPRPALQFDISVAFRADGERCDAGAAAFASGEEAYEHYAAAQRDVVDDCGRRAHVQRRVHVGRVVHVAGQVFHAQFRACRAAGQHLQPRRRAEMPVQAPRVVDAAPHHRCRAGGVQCQAPLHPHAAEARQLRLPGAQVAAVGVRHPHSPAIVG